MDRYTAILDIGSSKVICLICSSDARDGILVHGAGIREYPGYSHGVIKDEQQLSDAIVDALTSAEKEAKHRVRDISVGVPAPFTRLIMKEGKVEIKSRGRRISHRDIDELINASLDFAPPEGYELMHSTPVDFTVDGAARTDMPIGVSAKELRSDVSHLYVSSRFKRLVSDALLRVGLDADMYIAVLLSSGLFVIPEEVRAGGAILIDVGATHTDVGIVRNGAVTDMRTLDVGGGHFTGDLSYGLGVTRSVAEGVKRRYVYSLDYQDSIDTIRNPAGGVIRVEHAAIQYIVEARSTELAELIRSALEQMGVARTASLPAYMTGGGITLMRGGCEFLESRMGLPLQVAMPWMPRLSSPNYASAFSVMDFVIHSTDEGNAGRLAGGSVRGKLTRKIKEFFFR